ncbi:MAG: DsbE family thiol:disulfide interchange protein [Legionellaceae bacterium]
MKLSWRLVPFVMFMGLLLFFYRGLSLDPQTLPSVEVGKPLPWFELPPLKGDVPLSSTRFKGHVSMLNVWASWCPACTEEQAFLLNLKQQGVALYGLNYKDKASDAKAWLEEWGDPYQAIGQDITGRVAIDLGVYGAPETFLIDQQGIIRYRHVGALNATLWKKEFLPRIKALEEHA